MRASEIEGLLPAVFQRAVRPANTERAVEPSKPLRALLGVMEALHEPAEEVIATTLPTYFDHYKAPDEWLPFLATWVDLGWLLEWVNDEMGEAWLKTWYGHLRELIIHAPYLSRWRGTARGLERFLEVATGVPGFRVKDKVKDGGTILPFHIVVRAPTGAPSYQALVEKIVEMEKPAYVTYDIKWVRKP